MSVGLTRRARAVLTVVCLAAATTACGTGETADPAPSASEPSAEATASDTPTTDPSDPEDDMRIRITIGEDRFTATLEDSAAADDLLAQLPVTIDMTDHGGVERTGPLPSPLSLDDQPDGADPDVGDLGYYAPGNDLVLYYGDQSYFPGIVVLGRLDADAAARIARLDGTVTATVEAG